MIECDVVVVGAGISGLSAAKLLHESGINVVVLEARDRVGGRTWTIKNKDVGYCDLGGSYVGPTQNNLIRLAKELGVETYKVDETQDLIAYSQNKSRNFATDETPRLGGIVVQMDLNNFIRTIDKLGSTIPLDTPWTAPQAWKLDRTTFQDFINETCYTQEVKDFATLFLNLILTAEPWEASLLWVLWYVRMGDGFKRIFSTTNGAQERKFVGGSQQISEKMYELLGGPKRVLLSQPVCHITQENEKVYVRTLDGSTFKANYVIQATPPAVQQKIHYQPELPALRNQLIQRLPVGSVIKCILYYKTTFWKSLGFCGSIIISQITPEFDTKFTLNETKPDGSHPAIVCFIATDKLRRNYKELTSIQRKEMLSKNLAKVFGSDLALSPIHYEEKCWSEEQYSGGCYATIWAPGLLTTHGHVLREPIGRMYFAGTETATWWSCYMEGAVSAGERAAREILHKLRKISANEIWHVEPMSLDIPPIPFETTFWEKNAPSGKTVGRTINVITVTIVAVLSTWLALRYTGKNVACFQKLF